jgi:hypothetical protein
MKTLTALGTLVAGLLVLTLGGQGAVRSRENPTVVVGTFDSRAVAVAYIRSEPMTEYLRAQMQDLEQVLERARTRGDRELVAEVEELGPTMQRRFHEQGFGAAPVDDILAHIEDRLPNLAREAGVDVIVSKWSLAYTGSSARLVDVTDLLVAQFDPSDETLRSVWQLVETDPVPLDQLSDEH